MRILFDESPPRRLRGAFAGHAVSTVSQAGSDFENGELLSSLRLMSGAPPSANLELLSINAAECKALKVGM